jgi:hypothetical protein
MDTSMRLSERLLAGALFLLGCLFGIGSVALFTDGDNDGAPFLPDNIMWARGLIAAAAVTILLGFVLLAATLRAAGERQFSWIGLSALTLGTALTLFSEWLIVSGRVWEAEAGMEWLLLAWGSVALIFVGQAAYGVALLRATLLPCWIGWVLIRWNLGWLAVVVVFSARGPYYPVLFYLGPLLLGIVHLLRPAGAVRAVRSKQPRRPRWAARRTARMCIYRCCANAAVEQTAPVVSAHSSMRSGAV